MDEANRMKSQRLDVTVIPNQSHKVTDNLDLEVNGSYGFAVRLNHKARLDKILWNGAPARHAFGGGLLWVEIHKGVSGTLTLEYEIQSRCDQPAAVGRSSRRRQNRTRQNDQPDIRSDAALRPRLASSD